MEILKAWGFGSWGHDFGYELVYQGWQRVSLPQGWAILLEEYELILVDEKEQQRGRISVSSFLPRTEPSEFDKAISEGLKEAHAIAGNKKPQPPGPVLSLMTCIRKGKSFCLGDNGPYSFWVENAFGERLFGLYDIEVSDTEAKEKLPQLEQQIDDWLAEHYPDWQDFNAYWDVFE
ncbi:MAG: hypothetical protein AAB737_00055 [Patescibacteria group bacterium]